MLNICTAFYGKFANYSCHSRLFGAESEENKLCNSPIKSTQQKVNAPQTRAAQDALSNSIVEQARDNRAGISRGGEDFRFLAFIVRSNI